MAATATNTSDLEICVMAGHYEIETGKRADTLTISYDLWNALTEPFLTHAVSGGRERSRIYRGMRVILTNEPDIIEVFHSVSK